MGRHGAKPDAFLGDRMGFLDNGMPVDDLFEDEIADNFKLGDKVILQPKVSFLSEYGYVTETDRFANFVQVETESMGKRYYQRSKVRKMI